ncbi:MAG: CocE/NonD family hydrolase C-terminal non-catalytic domain-containing protein [Burkholderiales bacterium]
MPYRPYHSHDRKLPVRPGQVLELDIEIWPTSIVLPAGCRLALTVRGRDYVYPGTDPSKKPASGWPAFTGCGPFMHTESRDRPPAIFNGSVTVYTGPKHTSYVMLPIIPSVKAAAKKATKKDAKKR